MSATNYTPIYLYNSGTATNTPSAANLGAGELAINYADGKLFYKDGSAAVQVIAWKTTPTTAGGTGLTSYTAGDLPYYASGSTLSKLGIGTSGYVLQSNGSAPTWVAQSTLSVGTATNATNTAITDNTSSSATWYPTIVSATTGNLPQTTSSTKLSFVPSTGTLTATSHAGAWAGSTIGTTYGGTGLTSFTANGVVYASSTSALTTGSALVFDGANFGVGVTPSGWSGRTAFQFGAAGQLNYGSGPSNGGSSGYGNNGYWNGSADKAITTGYSQIVALNDNGTGRVIILTTSGTSSAGASISYTAGPYVAAGGVSWTNSSDERLKNITGEIQNGLSKVCSLRAAEFTWKDDASNKPQVGLIAQDVQAVLPEVISLTTKYNSEDKTEYLGVSYTETIPLLVAAIKELSAQVTSLQATVETQATTIATLQNKIGA